MKRTTTCLTVLLVALLGNARLCGAQLVAIDAGPLEVGVASAITSPDDTVDTVKLAGFGGRSGPSRGVHKDVTATCIVFDNGVTRLAFLALDILALRPAEHLDSLRAAAAAAGIPPQHLMINSSHTHYAPTIGRKGSYTELFKQRTESLFQAAVDDLKPAMLDYAVGSCTMGISKRQADAKGRVSMRPEPRKPIDPDVPVLRVLSAEGEVRAVMFGYACHPTSIGQPDWFLVNPDFPGFAREWISAAYPGCTPMFLQGCAGDIKPRISKPDPSGYGRFGYVLMEPLETVAELGHELGRAVLSAVMVPPAPVPSDRPTEPADALAAAVHLAGIVEKVRLPLRTDGTNDEKRTSDANGPDRLFEMGGWRVGDLYIIGLHGEVFAQIGMRIKRELAGTRVWTNGYTFAGAVYVPDAVSHREGGGVVRGTPLAETAEDAIVATAIRYAKELRAGRTGNGPVARP